jgi:hypothetical protein
MSRNLKFMAEDIKPASEPLSAFDPTIQTEKIAFDGHQLVPCPGCERMNPPNRFQCLYCGKGLEGMRGGDNLKPFLRKLELWEQGFNVVLLKMKTAPELTRISSVLSMEVSSLESLLSAETPIPVARVESRSEAEFVRTALEAMGGKALIVSDADLDPDRMPVRLRAIDFARDRLDVHNFNTGEVTSIAADELRIIVSGRLATARVDLTEKRGRGGKSKLLDETETTSDEKVLDLYRRGDSLGYRVNQAGFDFSCLGADKSLLAVQNMRTMVEKLRRIASNVVVVENYDEVRLPLSFVWELQSRKDPQGMRRTGYRVEFGTVASTNNVNQFTKYSRLQRHLYETQGKSKG